MKASSMSSGWNVEEALNVHWEKQETGRVAKEASIAYLDVIVDNNLGTEPSNFPLFFSNLVFDKN